MVYILDYKQLKRKGAATLKEQKELEVSRINELKNKQRNLTPFIQSQSTFFIYDIESIADLSVTDGKKARQDNAWQIFSVSDNTVTITIQDKG